jgi:hypothetical protein
LVSLSAQSGFLFSVPLPAAGSAHALATARYVGVVASKLVSIFTMCFLGMMCRCVRATQNIYLLRDSFQMCWIYAQRISAQMIDNAAFWQGAVLFFPGPAMRRNQLSLSRQFKVAVDTTVRLFLAAKPEPASVVIGLEDLSQNRSCGSRYFAMGRL